MKLLKRCYLGLILLFLYAPILVLIVFSFNSSRSRAVWGGFTLDWYRLMLRDSQIRDALSNTMSIAFLAAITATVIGTVAAIGINAMTKRSRKAVLNINNIPILNPDIVTGVSIMMLFVFSVTVLRVGKMGYMTMLLSHITFCIPYVITSVLPKLRILDKRLYEAALDLGATPVVAFFKVILPELLPSIISGAILAFTLSIDDFVISFFTTGAGVNNLAIMIYTSAAKRGIKPEINALSTFIFGGVMILLFLINYVDTRNSKKEAKRM